MKNLPDKIYLATTEEIQNLDSSFVGIAHSNPEDIIEPVEYIRKDAFIEKVLKYLDVNFYFNNSRYRIECAVFDSKKEMIEDFKKYIED